MHNKGLRLRFGWCAALLGLLAGCASEASTDGSEPLSASARPAAVTATSTARAAPPQPPELKPLVILAGGDVNLGRAAGQQILSQPGYDPFRHIRPWLEAADLRFINLESQLSEQNGETQSPDHKLKFTGPPGGADVLARAGIDIVSLANNHAWDYGRRGFEETQANLKRVGVAWTGASEQPGRQLEPTVVELAGRSIAFFGVTQIWNYGSYSRHPGAKHVPWANADKLREPVRQARAAHDLVLLSFHGGVEYRPVPFPPARRFIEKIMAQQVDVVLGHHPHVPRGVAWFDGRPAFHSLGNLIFDKRSNTRWERTSYLARLTFHPGGRRQFEVCPYDMRGHEPHPLTSEASQAEFREHLHKISKPFGGLRLKPVGADGCSEIEAPNEPAASVPE